MRDEIITQLQQGFETAFIDSNHMSNLAFKPQFISNNHREGRKVLSSIEDELLFCDQFFISVAFVTMSGIIPLLQTLKELENRNIPGQILTTDYLHFSEPKALEKLSELSNVTIKMYITSENQEGFHTKGYIFKRSEVYRIIVGSSNMTSSALTRNKEWNTKLISTAQGEYTQEILKEYKALWNSNCAMEYEDFITSYKTNYNLIKQQKAITKSTKTPSLEQYRLRPNTMQINFIGNFKKLIQDGEKRALLISATGTGKTYAAAFALREENPKKALFLVHREQIARQAIVSFKKVFGDTKTFGLLSGISKDYDVEYLFATIQTMSKTEVLSRYRKDEFSMIIVDEVHRSGAESYQRIMQYFKPDFFLGMTASPDRMDGFDIYDLFDHNIAYEIRLQQALEENLLCTFHYFGITELEIEGEMFDDNSGVKNFNNLISDQRVDYIIGKANYYGYSGDRVKGLIFCSRKQEAVELSKKFNLRGYRTEVLSGDDSQSKREMCIERLTSDECDDFLQYIFTVDIFNEGVDIPEINQVIMLRPTESPVVFVQQLGRGLRKAPGKEYVVILDFIGNYMNNFMIPVALSGDRSYNKDNMRRFVASGTKMVPGSSSIHFDEISRKRIYDSIDLAKTNELKLLKESYENLKYKLGRIPDIKDFGEHGEIDIMKIFEKFGSYYAFLVKYEAKYKVRLNHEEERVIEFLSKKMAKGKRIHELAIIKELVARNRHFASYIKAFFEEKYNVSISEKEETSIVLNLTNEFAKEEEKKRYESSVFIESYQDGVCKISEKFDTLLKHKVFADWVSKIVDFGIERYQENYANRYRETNFQLYQKYTYEDVCRLLNWKKNMNAQNIGGYFYDAETKTLPVFINYHKAEDAIAYKDRFIAINRLIALSKHPRKVTSSDVTHIYKRSVEDTGNKIYLFVRRNKDDKEAKEFYFLGEIYAIGEPKSVTMDVTKDDAFEIEYELDVPVREDIFDYIIGE